MTTKPSPRTKKAFDHLNTIKPYDGWAIDTYLSSSGQNLVMLKRRNAPLSNRGFIELALEQEKGHVVGIVSHIGTTGNCAYARGVSLVEKNGKVIRGAEEKRYTIDKLPDQQQQKPKGVMELKEAREEFRQNKERARDAVARNRENNGERNDRTADRLNDGFTDEQNQQLIRLAMVVFGAATLFRILCSSFVTYFVLASPMIGLYLINTCPKEDTFDAKKELKRVLRGEYMPENHPEKPKNDNWLSQAVTRLQATVTAEVATGLGHEVSFLNIYGLCILVTVHVPAMNLKLYYVGICDKWRYILHMNSEPSQAR